jgi:hypothetical protein
MSDELSNEIVGNLDQALPVDMIDALDEVDSVVAQAQMMGDPDIILNEIRANLGQVRASGLSLCKLLYKLQEMWNSLSDQDFKEAVFSHAGLGSTTVDRYVAIWTMYADRLLPDSVSSVIQQKPLRVQVPIAKLVEQGFKPTAEQWQKLSDAPDNSTTLAIVREIKGTEPRKSAILIFIDKSGHLSAAQDGEMIEIGMFYADALKSILGAKAINRIIDDSRIMEKNG